MKRKIDGLPWWYYSVMIALLGLAVLATYLLGLAGEPSSYWWWHNVFGVIP